MERSTQLAERWRVSQGTAAAGDCGEFEHDGRYWKGQERKRPMSHAAVSSHFLFLSQRLDHKN